MRLVFWIVFAFGVQAQTKNWIPRNPTGPKPSGNFWHSPIWDPKNETLIVYASNNSSIYSNTLFGWHRATNTWIQMWTSGSTVQDCATHVNTDTGPRDAHPMQNAWLDLNRNRIYY